MTALGTGRYFYSVFFYYTYKKRYTKQKSPDFSKNHLLKNTPVENTTISTELKTQIHNRNIENLRFLL